MNVGKKLEEPKFVNQVCSMFLNLFLFQFFLKVKFIRFWDWKLGILISIKMFNLLSVEFFFNSVSHEFLAKNFFYKIIFGCFFDLNLFMVNVFYLKKRAQINLIEFL